MSAHTFSATVRWTSDRNFEASAEKKIATIPGSTAPAFRGDPARYNPEELLIASLSSCHMLWYLHLCAQAGIVIRSYVDEAEGSMGLHAGSGAFSEVMLHPQVTIEQADRIDDAVNLHERAHEMCYIARSMNFPVRHEPNVTAS